MWWRRVRSIPVRRIVKRTTQAVLAVQGATIATLFVVDYRRKRLRAPAVFPRVPPKSVTAGGSEVTVYTYGEHLYADMLDAIRRARHTVYFETYIWKSDAVGSAFKQALIEAAERGVKVYVVWDEFGNLVVPGSFYRFPALTGHLYVKPHPLVARTFRFPRSSGRDHRKLLVIDDDAAFIGGYNIGSLYATDWRDTHARLTGDIVWDVQNAFVDYWNLETGKAHPELPDYGTQIWQPYIRLHRNVPRTMTYPIRSMYLEAMDRASHHIYLTSAYFIPDEDFSRALTRAAGRGVDVRIIVPAESNHIVADWLSRGFYGSLLRAGVRLFRYQGAMVHAKTCTIDGQWSTIGTANIDRLSMMGNYEINMEVFSPEVAHQMEEIFAIDSSNCIELTAETWRTRSIAMKFSETVLTPLRPLL